MHCQLICSAVISYIFSLSEIHFPKTQQKYGTTFNNNFRGVFILVAKKSMQILLQINWSERTLNRSLSKPKDFEIGYWSRAAPAKGDSIKTSDIKYEVPRKDTFYANSCSNYFVRWKCWCRMGTPRRVEKTIHSTHAVIAALILART